MANRATRIVRALAIYSLVGGLLTLAGWGFNIYRLADWDGDGIVQLPNNAVAVAAAAAGILCASFGRLNAARILGAIAAGIGFATLFEHAAHVDLGIDALLLNHDWGLVGVVAPGRMGVPGSAAMTILGLSTMALTTARSRNAARDGGIAAVIIALLSVIGYLFGANLLFAVPRLTAIAFQTSTMVLALGGALIASVPEANPMKLLLSESAAAMLFRRALPVIVIIPIALGWLRLKLHRLALFDTEFGTSMLILALILLLATLLWWGASAVAVQENAIRESRDRFSTLFQKASFPVSVSQLGTGAFVDVNEAFLEFFGFQRGEVLGRNSHDLGIDRDSGRWSEMREALERGTEVRNVELTLYTRSGDERVVLNTSTFVDIDGRRHVLSTIQDITERKAVEETMRKSTEALMAADRIKDEFLATLSHELRTPLTAIVGWSQLLLTGHLTPDQQRVALETIRSSANAQAQLVEDVLDVSRIVTGKMRIERENTNVAAIVDAAIATVRPAAEAKRIDIRFTVDRGLPELYVDPQRMQQVVWNLLSNAIKFSPIETLVEVTLRTEGHSALIVVEDQGPGISRDFLPYLFERFRQADNSATRAYAGLGIGLALTKSLVELHGGTINVDTEEGRGTRFTVRLPMPARTRDDAADSQQRPLAPETLNGVRVLFVDDRDDARLLIGTMLKRQGAQVSEAASVDDALVRLTTSPFDVVITDLAMPARDGYELLAAIKADQRWAKLPVLALTAQGRADDEARSAAAGFRSFLRKPIDPDDLGTAIVRALGRQ